MNELTLPKGRITVAKNAFYTPEQLALGERYYRMFTGMGFGECLSDCFNPVGAAVWSHMIREQERAYREGSALATYDVVRNEVSAIHTLGPAIAEIIVNDPDLDRDNLIVTENGSGSRDAVLPKTIVQLGQIRDAGGVVRMYSPWEKSDFFRAETVAVMQEQRPDIVVNPQNVDFTKDDPNLFMPDHPDIDVEGPRIILENGTPRSNISTSSPDELPTEELYRIFAHNAKVCRPGGYLVMNCDGDQNGERNEAKYKDAAHAQVGQAYTHYGQRQGVISENYEPLTLYYRPIWEGRRSVIRHSLIAAAGQTFGVLRQDGHFHRVTLKEGDGYDGSKNVHSQSWKWRPEIMRAAAEKAGFRTIMAEPSNPADPQNYTYVFKRPAFDRL